MGFFDDVFSIAFSIGDWAANEPNKPKRILKYLVLILFSLGIIAFIVWIIWRIIVCNEDTYYIKRDYLNLISYSYDVRNKKNKNILRVEGSFPAQFSMTPVANSEVPKEFTALDMNLIDLNFLFLPEYQVLDQNKQPIGKLEREINLAYYKYIINVKGIPKIKTQEWYNTAKDLPADMYFYIDDKRVAKSTRTASGNVIRNYKLCVNSDLDPRVKELIFLATIAMDQHK